MTSCQQSTETLASFVNDDMDASASRMIRAHLLVCARCLRVVEDLRAINALAPTLPEPPIPAEERTSILRAIAQAAEQVGREAPRQGTDGTQQGSASSSGSDIKPS